MFKKAVVVAGSLAMLSLAAPAYADTTSGQGGVLSGNQVFAPITIPIDVCGNAVAILGVAIAGCKGGATAIVHR